MWLKVQSLQFYSTYFEVIPNYLFNNQFEKSIYRSIIK